MIWMYFITFLWILCSPVLISCFPFWSIFIYLFFPDLWKIIWACRISFPVLFFPSCPPACMFPDKSANWQFTHNGPRSSKGLYHSQWDQAIFTPLVLDQASPWEARLVGGSGCPAASIWYWLASSSILSTAGLHFSIPSEAADQAWGRAVCQGTPGELCRLRSLCFSAVLLILLHSSPGCNKAQFS